MRWPLIILTLLVVVLQYPLWLGRGGWLRAWDVDRQLQAQRDTNRRLEQRNAGLAAEVNDLKSGNEAIEERARFDLGLTHPNEIFVQVPKKQAEPPANRSATEGRSGDAEPKAAR